MTNEPARPVVPAPAAWIVFVYRVPAEPSSTRVAVWRDLKRIGALYLQQCVCVVPDRPDLRAALTAVRDKVRRLGGSVNLFDVPQMDAEDAAALVSGFRDLAAQQYAEIVEECETKFVKEIEFEHFRQNYTFAEAEEIEQDLEKIRRWYERVRVRDWFEASGRAEVDAWIDRCSALLDQFYEVVHTRTAAQAGGPDAPAAGPMSLPLDDPPTRLHAPPVPHAQPGEIA